MTCENPKCRLLADPGFKVTTLDFPGKKQMSFCSLKCLVAWADVEVEWIDNTISPGPGQSHTSRLIMRKIG